MQEAAAIHFGNACQVQQQLCAIMHPSLDTAGLRPFPVGISTAGFADSSEACMLFRCGPATFRFREVATLAAAEGHTDRGRFGKISIDSIISRNGHFVIHEVQVHDRDGITCSQSA